MAMQGSSSGTPASNPSAPTSQGGGQGRGRRRRRGTGNRGSQGNKGRSDDRKPASKRSADDHDQYCYDCGDPGHYRGDLVCKNPSFQTKKRRENEDLRSTISRNRDKDDSGHKGHFRPGSNPRSN